ncbi:ribosylnicotinamide kinase [Onygenales sp. PD_40]|nr:ribosylnicotinamide kinase [Onygenales sp. PD_40]
MARLSHFPLRAAVIPLILLLNGEPVFGQFVDDSPLTSPDIGWTISTVSGTRAAVRMICDYGETFTKSESYYACCPTSASSSCAIPTTCAGNNLRYPGGKKKDCEENACGPLFLYESAPEENLLGTQLVCRLGRFGDTPWTAYRHFPDATATATHSTKTDASPASTTSLPEQTSTSTTTSTATPTPSPSKAWIAGVVIGIVVAAALIGALGFFIARRKFRPKPGPPKNEDGAPANPFASPEDKPWEGQGVGMGSSGPAELHNTHRPIELGHYGHNVVEMPVHNERRFMAELDGAPVGRR